MQPAIAYEVVTDPPGSDRGLPYHGLRARLGQAMAAAQHAVRTGPWNAAAIIAFDVTTGDRAVVAYTWDPAGPGLEASIMDLPSAGWLPPE
jgi:hypothetical protein